jgi:lipopolysaccharide/colanic/teichoic acid biosynthesis glycosyltransferase
LTTSKPVPNFSWLEHYLPEKAFFRGRSYELVKRMMDLILVVLSFPAWLLLIGLLIVIVKIESPIAPVFFVQPRTGKNGRRFNMIKFRTMVVNAEELKEKYAHLNELKWPDFKITNDPRVTRLGRFMRKSSLDELPQLINVLKGEMSLVGPRPTSFTAKNYALWQTERLDVIPGMTGLWQVIGRGETEFNDRLRMDIAYIEHRCISLDINILFRTVTAIFQQRGTF